MIESVTPPAPITDVAGYRVLRTLARGDRCDVLLGYRPPDVDTDSGHLVALKRSRFFEASAGDSTSAEITALERARGDHVVAVLDVELSEQESCLVLERLERGSLADLLGRRSDLELGEVVTILAPLVQALSRMHAAGVAHTRVSASTVLFSADGAPVLVGFGGAALFGPGLPAAALDGIPAVAADREGIRELARLVLERVRPDAGGAIATLRARIGSMALRELPGGIQDELFGVAAPTEIRFDDEARIPAAVAAIRPREEGTADEGQRGHALPHWLAGLVPAELRENAGLRRLAEMWKSVSPRHRRIGVGILAAGIVLLLATTLLNEPSAAGTGSASTPAPMTEGIEREIPPVPTTDDPVVALTALLEARRACLRDLSVLCLDDVDQPGSPALDADRAAIAALADGEEIADLTVASETMTIVERLGDTALVDLPDGGAVDAILLLRGPDGWRIREYLRAAATRSRAGPRSRPPRDGP